MDVVYIRAEIVDTNISGQKKVHIIADNADGLCFWTDNKSIVRMPRFCPNCGANMGRIMNPQEGGEG